MESDATPRARAILSLGLRETLQDLRQDYGIRNKQRKQHGGDDGAAAANGEKVFQPDDHDRNVPEEANGGDRGENGVCIGDDLDDAFGINAGLAHEAKGEADGVCVYVHPDKDASNEG